jgi:hypothetical protein
MKTYSLIWMHRKVRPSRKVVSIPTRRAARFSLRAPSSAQCIVKLDESRIAVLTPAMATGRSTPSIGNHPASFTTRMKK